jgi:hypothetical protein
MRLIQYVALASLVYFSIRIYSDHSEEAKTCALMALIVLFLILLIASHYRGVENKEISDEIIKNHSNSINRANRGGNNYGKNKF